MSAPGDGQGDTLDKELEGDAGTLNATRKERELRESIWKLRQERIEEAERDHKWQLAAERGKKLKQDPTPDWAMAVLVWGALAVGLFIGYLVGEAPGCLQY